MGNFFGEIAGTPSESETVSGVFECGEYKCFDIVEEAEYFEKESMLYWVCEEGHENKVKDFNIG